MFAEPRPQRTMGSDSQGKAGNTRIRKSKEKGDPGNLRMTEILITPFTLTPIAGITPRDRSLDVRRKSWSFPI
jgi:hypothetical protein